MWGLANTNLGRKSVDWLNLLKSVKHFLCHSKNLINLLKSRSTEFWSEYRFDIQQVRRFNLYIEKYDGRRFFDNLNTKIQGTFLESKPVILDKRFQCLLLYHRNYLICICFNIFVCCRDTKLFTNKL